MDKAVEVTEEQWEFGPESLFFVGQPPNLLGHIVVQNHSDQKLKLKRIAVRGFNLETAPNVRLETLSIFAKLAPRARMQVPVNLTVNPHTPPGTYEDSSSHCSHSGKLESARPATNFESESSRG